MPCGDGERSSGVGRRAGAGLSASEPARQDGQPWATQLAKGTRPTGDRHQYGFGRPGDLQSRAVTPVQVTRNQTHASGEVPGREFGAAYGVRQHNAKTISRDLSWLA